MLIDPVGGQSGAAVDIDRDTVVIGAPLAGGGPGGGEGRVGVWVRGESGWAKQSTLAPSVVGTAARFGNAVAISGDTVLVGRAR